MASNGNVVALGDRPRARQRLSPQESAGVLAGCRDLALERMSRALAGMLDRVESELHDLADKALDPQSREVFLDARAQAHVQRSQLEAAFRRHFLELFNRKVRGIPGAASAAPAELALVAHEDLEESIAVSDMARKLREACDAELFALGERVGFLLERPDLDDEANPVSPATVFAALRSACEQVSAQSRVRIELLRRLEHHAEAELRSIYAELNAHLVARRILPDVRPSVRRAANAPAAQVPTPQGSTDKSPPDLFATLAQLLAPTAGLVTAPAAGGSAPVGSVQGGSVPGGAVAGAAFPGPGAAVPAAGAFAGALLAELTRIHREWPAGAADASSHNVVRGIKSGAHAASLGPIEAMTIDIVAMLFDYVFEDRHIPATVKALLGRLQIPTLKVALIDKGFFTARSHPARRLIDALASASIGLDDRSAGSGGTLAMVEEVVQRVLAEFDTDVALFESLVARVEAFVAERDRAEAEVVRRTAQVVEARNREETAHATGEGEVAARLQARAWVPSPVRAMLLDHWSRALAWAVLAEGEGGAAWQALAATMDDLLWSVEPKVSPEERKRLVARLPRLLASLQDGMRRAGVAEAERDRFLGELVDCHAAAVKAGLRGLAIVPEPPPLPEPVEPPTIERAVVPAGDLQVEEIRLRTPRGAPVRNVFTRTGIWTNLQRGTWAEFARTEGGAMRARLTWISPNKAVYLFTNPLSGSTALSISPEALAEQLRRGEARLLDDAPLVARAVDSMIATLRRAPGAG